MTDTTESPNAVVIHRLLDAPTERVWQMWTDPTHFAAWYGPTGARIPVADMDVTIGGKRLICMEMDTPDGPMQMWFTGEYVEIVENARLVYTESMSDPEGNVQSPAEMGMPADQPTTTQVTVELTDDDGRTQMVLTHAGIPSDSPGAMGWNMALDKLADRVTTTD